MELFLVTWVGVKDLELSSIPGEGKHDHIFFIVLVLNAIHHDKVEVVQVDKTDGLGYFVA